MRLIDADALIEFCAERWIPLNIDAVNMQPTIQPEKAQLSQEGTTKDAINRQQALDAAGKYASVWMEYTDAMSKDEIAQIALNNAKSTMIRILKELPTAQPETAKRIVGKSRDGMTLWYQCDMCNEPVDAQDNYCRECGRRLIDG